MYPLEHQYTQRGLSLAFLKGADSHRTLHVLQASAEHDGFFVLLGIMELYVTDPNSEEDYRDLEFEYRLTHIVDTDGFDLSMYKALTIAEVTLLRQTYDENRAPDRQQGGGYLGNQHAEIDQVFCDSVSPGDYILGAIY